MIVWSLVFLIAHTASAEPLADAKELKAAGVSPEKRTAVQAVVRADSDPRDVWAVRVAQVRDSEWIVRSAVPTSSTTSSRSQMLLAVRTLREARSAERNAAILVVDFAVAEIAPEAAQEMRVIQTNQSGMATELRAAPQPWKQSSVLAQASRRRDAILPEEAVRRQALLDELSQRSIPERAGSTPKSADASLDAARVSAESLTPVQEAKVNLQAP